MVNKPDNCSREEEVMSEGRVYDVYHRVPRPKIVPK
jgi:hypothetical protein